MPKTNGTKGTAKKQWDNEFPIDPNNQITNTKGAKKKKPKTKKKKLGHTCKYRNKYVVFTNYEYNKKPVYEVKNMVCLICGRKKSKNTWQHYYKKSKDEYEAVSLSAATSLRTFYRENNWKKEFEDMLEKHYGRQTMILIFGEGAVSQKFGEDYRNWQDIYQIDEGEFKLSEPAEGFEEDMEMWNAELAKLKIKNDKAKVEWYKMKESE